MSGRKRRVFDPAFKVSVVERLMSGERIEALSAELGVLTFHLYKWRLHFCRGGPRALRRPGRPRRVVLASGAEGAGAGEAEELLAARRRIAELEGKIGRQRLDVKTRRTMTPGSAKINWRNLLHFLIPTGGHDRRRL
jgi:transposase-like protein